MKITYKVILLICLIGFAFQIAPRSKPPQTLQPPSIFSIYADYKFWDVLTPNQFYFISEVLYTKVGKDRDVFFHIEDINHIMKVAILAYWLAEEMNLKPYEKRYVVLGALLHDIGKAHPAVRKKFHENNTSNTITLEDRKMHIMVAKEILRLFSKDHAPIFTAQELKVILYCIGYHHYYFNKTGYKIAGDIPDDFQEYSKYVSIITVADHFDAATNTFRRFRTPKTVRQFLKELINAKNTIYSRQTALYFSKLLREKFIIKKPHHRYTENIQRLEFVYQKLINALQQHNDKLNRIDFVHQSA